ncbi:MAG TPA: DUF1559 domain-containing protein [Isosphaeraceae bacterium]|nr:DUF1559 domain-containing protein [Isosphaeraceae bacterium]
MKQLSLAVHNYSANYGCLPPAYVADVDGRPMHSWRVLLLPYLEQLEVYNAYNFSEPWNGPNNSKLAGRIGSIFRRPESNEDPTKTSFVAIVGAETAFPGARALKLDDIGDGTSNTIIFVEIPNSDISWMEPRDLAFDQMSFKVNPPHGRAIGSPYGAARIALVDGSVRSLKDKVDPKVLRALITAKGGETVRSEYY